jgi:bifunctional DNA-binding transcriptional regulator/antitoxin component of YhaV-PrlF toxin-antitoxin module
MSRRMTVTLDDRGRLTLPENLRKKYGWTPGTTFFIREDGGVLMLASAQNPFESASETRPDEAERARARARLTALVEEIRSRVPADLTEEEIDRDVQEAIEEVRRERRARRR